VSPPSLQEWRRVSLESTMRSKARRSEPQPASGMFLLALFALAALGLAVYVVGWVL
jgi:hypothetical protein